MTVTHLRPEHVEYERALVGAALLGCDLGDLSAIVVPSDFYNPAHETIWKAALAVDAAGWDLNPLTVLEQLRKSGANLERLGGAPYLHTCLAACPSPSEAPWLAERVAEAAQNRRLDELQVRVGQLAATTRTPAEKREQVQTWLDEMNVDRKVKRVTPADVLGEVIDVAQHGKDNAYPTRWPDLNRVIDGWYPGQLITVAARPGVGKSIFGGNSATDMAATHGQWVYFASLEMSAFELTQRMVAEKARVNLQALKQGREAVNSMDWKRIERSHNQVSSLPIQIVDSPTQSVAQIRAGARALQRQSGLGLVVVDYLLLLDPVNSQAPLREQLRQMTRDLKRMARELQVPVMMLTQLRRSDRPEAMPTANDLKESGSIEEDSDVVILLHWNREEPSVIKALVEKNRSGLSQVVVDLTRWGHYAVLE